MTTLIDIWIAWSRGSDFMVVYVDRTRPISCGSGLPSLLLWVVMHRKRWNGRIALKALQWQGNTHRNKGWKFQLQYFSKIRVSRWNVISHANPYKIQRSTCFSWYTLSLGYLRNRSRRGNAKKKRRNYSCSTERPQIPYKGRGKEWRHWQKISRKSLNYTKTENILLSSERDHCNLYQLYKNNLHGRLPCIL